MLSTIMARLAGGERVDHLETTRSRKDGFKAQVSLTVSPIKGSDGQVAGLSGSLTTSPVGDARRDPSTVRGDRGERRGRHVQH